MNNSTHLRHTLTAPLLSIILLVLGNGVTTTLTTWQLSNKGASEWDIGLVSGAYFAGLLVSCFTSQKYVLRVGHIRAYSAFTCVVAVSILLQGLHDNLFFWALLRFINGYALTGLIIVIESWLVSLGNPSNRGFILSLYMASYYGAQSLSQKILNIPFSIPEVMPFCFISALCMLSILPLCNTRFLAPCPENPSILPFKLMLKKAPIGVWGAACSGLVLGAVYGMFPHYFHLIGCSKDEVGDLMMTTILGAALLQFPIGKLSDKFDRRKVLLCVCLTSIAIFTLMFYEHYTHFFMLGLVFFMGGSIFGIYPVCSSHTIDNITHDEIVSGISALMLAYGVGITISPILMSSMMTFMGPQGLIVYLIAMCAAMGFYTFKKILINAPKVHDEHNDFRASLQNTPQSVNLDPRVADTLSGSHD